MKPVDIGKFVHRKTMERVEAGEEYWKAFHQILAEDEDLKSLYAGMTSVKKGPAIKPKEGSSQKAGSELDRLTREFMRQMDIDDYCWALKQIMRANPQLTKKYAQS